MGLRLIFTRTKKPNWLLSCYKIKRIHGDLRFLRALILRLLAVGVKLLAIDSDGVR